MDAPRLPRNRGLRLPPKLCELRWTSRLSPPHERRTSRGGPTRGEWWTTRAGPDHPLGPLGMAKIERNDDSWRKTACAHFAHRRGRPIAPRKAGKRFCDLNQLRPLYRCEARSLAAPMRYLNTRIQVLLLRAIPTRAQFSQGRRLKFPRLQATSDAAAA
jgi:hypothetical protein